MPNAARGLAALLAAPLAASFAAGPAPAGTPSPADWRDQAIYQILTDRFFNGDPSNDAVEGFFDPADGARNHGGDWAGIEARLDYVQGLGATAVWISPVQTNAFAAYHGYHIRDFYGFSAHFGGLSALRSLVDAAHARGMWVILDVIANHGGDLIDSGDPGWPAYDPSGSYTLRWRDPGTRAAPPFDDLARYHRHGHIGDFSDPEQVLGELFGLDDFRTEDPAVRQDLIDAHTWLIAETDADGFRIDTVKHVDFAFWEEFAPAVRQFAADSLGKDSFFLYGEVFDGSPAKNGIYTGSAGSPEFLLDSVLWYPMFFASRPVFRDGAPTQWLSFVTADSSFYDPSAVPRLVNFLDNHDNGRFQGFQSGAERDDAKTAQALAWLHTSLGIPVVYYGTEQEFDGGGDPFNREDMWDGQWDFGPSDGDNFDQTAPLYRRLRRLNGLRAGLPALRRGAQEDVASDPGGAGLYAYHRRLAGEETVLVIVNTAPAARTLVVDPDLPAGPAVDGLSGRTVEVPAAGSVAITVGGHGAVVLSAAPPDPAPWVARTWPPHDGTLRSALGQIRVEFDEPMDAASVEAALAVAPSFPHGTRWLSPRVLVIEPAAALPDGARLAVSIAGTAAAADGGTLGARFSFEFDTDFSAWLALPTGVTANPLPDDDLRTPLSLAAGARGTPDAGEVLLGDTGWDRVLALHDAGFVEARVVDGAIGRPASLALDVPGGAFDGDLLIADRDRLLRAVRDGAGAGRVETVAALPAVANDWIVAVDPTGAYAGFAFVGRAGDGTVRSVAPDGTITAFAAGLGGVTGLAFAPGGVRGTELHVLSSGALRRLAPDGTPTVLASGGALAGAASLAFDPSGAFGGDLFAARSGAGEIVRVDAAGEVTPFASGFAGFPGGDALAFGALGDLWVVESGGGTERVVKIVPDSADSIVTTVSPRPTATGITFAGPNPFTASTTLELAVPDDGIGAVPVRVSVHDVAGREVRVLLEGEAAPGRLAASWDGRDHGGRPVSAGVYVVRFTAGARTDSRKLVRLR